jgi:uncharacterized protein DUF6894
VPLYFFHLNFGHRMLPDDEGVDLPSRSAARAEASAVIRDLSDPEVGGNPRRWAGWFLQVADGGGQFLRMPIGHPARELVTADNHELHTEAPNSKPAQPTVAAARESRALKGIVPAELFRELAAHQQHAAQLLERSRQLQRDLSSVYIVSKNTQLRARHLVAHARLARAAIP